MPRRMPLSRSVPAALAALFLAAGLAGPSAAQGFAGPYLAAEQAAARGDIVAAADFYDLAMARDASHPDLVEQAMTHQLAAGRVPQAVSRARQVVAREPDQHLAVLVLAAEALRNGEPAKIEAVLPAEDAPFVARVLGAWAKFDLGDHDGARAILDDLGGSDTGGPAGRVLADYHIALMEAAEGDDLDAADAIARAVEATGGAQARLARVQAGILARLERPEEALARLDALAEQGLDTRRTRRLAERIRAGEVPEPLVVSGVGGTAEALHGVARHLMRGPNWVVGIAYLRLATYLDADMMAAHMLIGDTLYARDQHQLAIAAYEAVPNGAPEALEAQIGRANALAEDERLGEAVAALRGLVTRHPDAMEAHTALGDILRRNERFAEAATAYEGAVALIETPEQRHWPLFYQRGISHERSDQWEKAEADLLKALELQPGQPLVLNYLGYSWVDKGVKLDRAQDMIETAVEKRPEDGYIVDSLGWVKYRLGEFEAAAKHLGRAVELNPVDPVINDHFGDALWMVGRRVEAEFQWRRALSFDPDPELAERIERKLAVGLDAVQAAEAEAGKPAIIGRSEAAPAGGDNDGG